MHRSSVWLIGCCWEVILAVGVVERRPLVKVRPYYYYYRIIITFCQTWVYYGTGAIKVSNGLHVRLQKAVIQLWCETENIWQTFSKFFAASWRNRLRSTTICSLFFTSLNLYLVVLGTLDLRQNVFSDDISTSAVLSITSNRHQFTKP